MSEPIPDLQELVRKVRVPDDCEASGFGWLFYVQVSEAEKLLKRVKELEAENRKLRALVDGFMSVAKDHGDVT